MGRDIQIGGAENLAWDPANVSKSLAELRAYVEDQAGKATDWYLQRKEIKAWFSRYMRFGVIVATGLGALFPIGAQLWGGKHPWAQSGLVPALLVGVAAALLGADHAFGFSTGWIRYITTAGVIRKALEEFRLDWMLKTSQASLPPTPGQVAELVHAAKTFRLAVESYVIDETRAWAMEFQNTLAQLEKDTSEKFDQLSAQVRQEAKQASEKAEQQRAQAEQDANALANASRPGSIQLSVPNSADADDRTVKVQMDGEGVSVVDMMVGARRWSRIGLKPGYYRIVVSAQAGNKPINDQVVCEIRPGELLKAEMKLPIGGS